MTPATLRRWWIEGARTALFRRPRWQGLEASPAIAFCLLAVPLLAVAVIERLYIVGAARPYWQALFMGWFATTATAWSCWLAVSGRDDAGEGPRPPAASDLFCMLAAQVTLQILVLGVVFVPLARSGRLPTEAGGYGLVAVFVLPTLWQAATAATLVARTAAGRLGRRAAAMAVVAALPFLQLWAEPPRLWYPHAEPDTASAETDRLMRFTPEVIDRQHDITAAALGGLAPGRPGTVDVYSVTYAPYADEDVFRNESALVTRVMEQRFDAAGRSVQLINHASTADTLPWATPRNLRRSIQQVALRMNRDEDVLFIYLTSHGAADGKLSTSFWPLTLEPVTPAMLKGWLDEAGVKWRVISVSACFSGSWVAPLESDDTLVMTAADAQHTSYGCGRKSELTYFGRAMFDEQLRSTWSFEDAHAAAREVIRRREIDAGKTDGYSNPQIGIGSAIRPRLARLAAERAASSPR